MSADYEKLRSEEADKSSKLQELMSVPNHQHSTNNTDRRRPLTPPHREQTSNIVAPAPSIASPTTTTNQTTTNAAGKSYKNQLNSVVHRQQQQQQQHQHSLTNHRRPFSVRTKRPHWLASGSDADDFDIPTKVTRQSISATTAACTKRLSASAPLSLFGTLCHTVPLAMPTLQLHLLISLTLVWLTHRCPQYLIVM